jgi:hypothetical protein
LDHLPQPDRCIREKAADILCELCRGDEDNPRFAGTLDDDRELLGEVISASPDSHFRSYAILARVGPPPTELLPELFPATKGEGFFPAVLQSRRWDTSGQQTRILYPY